MSLITLASVKGSPGVTTLACLMGASWSTDSRIVVAECDAAGGDLAPRFALSRRSGWATLVGAARRDTGDLAVDPHLQRLPGGLEVLVGTTGRELGLHGPSARKRAEEALITLSADLDVLVDLGRLDPDLNRSEPWLGLADTACIVVPSEPSSLVHLHERAEEIRERVAGEVYLIVVGEGTYRSDEITRFTGMDVLAMVPNDPTAASVVTSGIGSRRRLERSPLAAAARRIATMLVDRTTRGGVEAPEAVLTSGAVDAVGRAEEAESTTTPDTPNGARLKQSVGTER